MTLRPKGGELAIVTGIPGAGKSEFLDALMLNLARLHGWTFGLCSFENEPSEHVAKLAEKYNGAPFWDGPRARMTRTDLDLSISWIDDRFTFIRAGDEAPTLDWILQKARSLVLRRGIRGLVIDPWNEVESRRPPAMTETEYVSQSLGKLKRFAYGHGVYTWLVSHPVKLYSENGQILVPTAYDISGSANWANKGDMIFTVHRPDIKSHTTEIHVRKARRKWLGKRGMASLDYDPATGRHSEGKS
jgi:twinkle protein